MVNILLDRYNIDAPWLFDHLKEYIKPYHKILVVAFSFRDNRVRDNSDWQALYGKNQGKLYRGIVDSFKSYGIKEESIELLNYFTDTKESANTKVESCDILYFLGGLPDRMFERLKEFDLIDVMLKHKGIIMGYSAGAVIQLEEYYLSPDNDYPEFSYYEGIPYINDFYIQSHYENTDIQNLCIKKVLAEKNKTVYAIDETGALIVDNGAIKTIGNIKAFLKNK